MPTQRGGTDCGHRRDDHRPNRNRDSRSSRDFSAKSSRRWVSLQTFFHDSPCVVEPLRAHRNCTPLNLRLRGQQVQVPGQCSKDGLRASAERGQPEGWMAQQSGAFSVHRKRATRAPWRHLAVLQAAELLEDPRRRTFGQHGIRNVSFEQAP